MTTRMTIGTIITRIITDIATTRVTIIATLIITDIATTRVTIIATLIAMTITTIIAIAIAMTLAIARQVQRMNKAPGMPWAASPPVPRRIWTVVRDPLASRWRGCRSAG
ncbi:hypothetical protein [Halomonas denitrificans]|uniref:hypothetical protein n=1 Tax=Halomonas denitrificans TaxID=370769 RepID=UPI0021BDACAE|nr:hypothetical protein [Halomonas denitrificans]